MCKTQLFALFFSFIFIVLSCPSALAQQNTSVFEFGITFSFHDIYIIEEFTDTVDNIDQYTQIVDINPGPSFNPSWSADGRLLAVEAISLLANDESARTITVFDTYTEEVIYALSSESHSFRRPEWSPVSNKIAYVSDLSGNWGIYIFDLENESTVQIIDSIADEGVHGLSWSPNGERLVFTSGEGPDNRIEIVDLNNPQDIDPNEVGRVRARPEILECFVEQQFYDINWSINNDLAIVVVCQSETQIISINVNNLLDDDNSAIDNRLLLTDSIVMINTGIDWSPDGNAVLFVGIPQKQTDEETANLLRDTELYMTKIADGEIIQLTHSPQLETIYLDPVWRPATVSAVGE